MATESSAVADSEMLEVASVSSSSIQWKTRDLLWLTVLLALSLAWGGGTGALAGIGLGLTWLVAFGRVRFGRRARGYAWKLGWFVFLASLFLPTLAVGCVRKTPVPVPTPNAGRSGTPDTAIASPLRQRLPETASPSAPPSRRQAAPAAPPRWEYDPGYRIAVWTAAAILDVVFSEELSVRRLFSLALLFSLSLVNLTILSAPLLVRSDPGRSRRKWLAVVSISVPAAWVVGALVMLEDSAGDSAVVLRIGAGYYVWNGALLCVLAASPLQRRHWYTMASVTVGWCLAHAALSGM